jgi:hypothetical protein
MPSRMVSSDRQIHLAEKESMRSQDSGRTGGPDAFPTTRSSSELEQILKFHRILLRGPVLRTKVGGEKTAGIRGGCAYVFVGMGVEL